MKSYFLTAIILVFTMTACAQNSEIKKEDLKTQMQKVSYAIGQDIGKNFKRQEIEIGVKELAQGLKDALAGNSLMTDEDMQAVLMQFQKDIMAQQQEKQSKVGAKNKTEGEAYLEENKKKEGVVTLPSGLQYNVIKKGSGPHPTDSDKVKVHYKGTFVDGEEFDSSYKRDEPITFSVLGVIPGWTEALKLMSVGDKWELAIPYNLAYGPNGKAPKIGPYQTLLFEVELLEINPE